MILRLLALICILFVHAPKAQALGLDIDALYYTDNFTYSEDSSYNRLLWDVGIMFNLDKKGRFVAGWGYGSRHFEEDASGTTTELSITEMGPRFGFYFDKQGAWSLFVTYYLQAKGEYTATDTTELRGTSLKGELLFSPVILESFSFGIKLNYYQSSFGEEIIDSTTLESVSYSRSTIYPSLAFSYRWN